MKEMVNMNYNSTQFNAAAAFGTIFSDLFDEGENIVQITSADPYVFIALTNMGQLYCIEKAFDSSVKGYHWTVERIQATAKYGVDQEVG